MTKESRNMEQSNTSRLWQECRNAFLATIKGYYGTIDDRGGELTFSAKNRFIRRYNDDDGWHESEKTVPTTIAIDCKRGEVAISAEEKTCEIAGGCFVGVDNLTSFTKTLSEMLRRWKFKEKKEKYEQMTLF